MTSAGASDYDVIVVGAGPAGLAAATLCASHGVSTLLLDEQYGPGGQIYRAIAETPLRDRSLLGKDYWRGKKLLRDFENCLAHYQAGATVWAIASNLETAYSVGGKARLAKPQKIILATGALERPAPIRGWTLPGVMTAGAAQILLKTSGLTSSGPTVLAGSGPLLWLLAWQYLRMGRKLDAILDTTPLTNYASAAGRIGPFLASPYFFKGLKLLLQVRAKVRVWSHVTELYAGGGDKVEFVGFKCAVGISRKIAVDTLLLHQGVIPNTSLTRALNCEHVWNELQACWQPVADEAGRTSVPGVAIAGDGSQISGALAAEHSGRIAALGALADLGILSKKDAANLAGTHRNALRNASTGRAFLDTLYRPSRALLSPLGETVVCRCEEVTAEQIRSAVDHGCQGPNQLKAFLRCGMGPCQGRLCGPTVTNIISDQTGRSPTDVGSYRIRQPIKPVTLDELSGLTAKNSDKISVNR